jgi:hypothetical protein
MVRQVMVAREVPVVEVVMRLPTMLLLVAGEEVDKVDKVVTVQAPSQLQISGVGYCTMAQVRTVT